MPGAPTVESSAADPKFRALDPSVQMEVLGHLDPKYAALAPSVQQEVLTHLLYSPEIMQRVSQGEAKQETVGPGSPIAQEVARRDAAKRKSQEGLYELGHGFTEPPPGWQPPQDAKDAAQRLGDTTQKYASGELALYSMGIPGPGKAASLPLQIAKGAAFGGGTSAGLYAASRWIHGEFPDLAGTSTALVTGAIIGGIAEPLLQLPGVRRAVARIPALKKFMAPSKAEEFDAQMEQRAQDLMRRGKEQEALDLKQAMAARRATAAARQEAKDKAAEIESAKFKPSEDVKRSMGPRGTKPYDPQADAGFAPPARPRAKGLPPPPRSAEDAEAAMRGGSGVRPSESEARITYLIRKPVLTPDEAAELERALGPRWKLMRGQGQMEHQAETLGLVRARRTAQGMREPN